jgi:hypothetical protein
LFLIVWDIPLHDVHAGPQKPLKCLNIHNCIVKKRWGREWIKKSSYFSHGNLVLNILMLQEIRTGDTAHLGKGVFLYKHSRTVASMFKIYTAQQHLFACFFTNLDTCLHYCPFCLDRGPICLSYSQAVFSRQKCLLGCWVYLCGEANVQHVWGPRFNAQHCPSTSPTPHKKKVCWKIQLLISDPLHKLSSPGCVWELTE